MFSHVHVGVTDFARSYGKTPARRWSRHSAGVAGKWLTLVAEAITNSISQRPAQRAAFELFSRMIRCRNRQRSQAGQSRRLLGDRLGQRVIGVARERHRLRGFQLLDTRRGQRDERNGCCNAFASPHGADIQFVTISPTTKLAEHP